MTKEDMVEMIEARIRTEYSKYHGTSVDFFKTAALKIIATLEYNRANSIKPDSENRSSSE